MKKMNIKDTFFVALSMIVISLIVVGCVKIQEDGKPTVLQGAYLSSDKNEYLVGENITLNWEIVNDAVYKEINVKDIKLKLQYCDSNFKPCSSNDGFDDIFNIIEIESSWQGIIKPKSSKNIDIIIRSLKEGLYYVSPFVTASELIEVEGQIKERGNIGFKIKNAKLCIGKDLETSKSLCKEKGRTNTRVEAEEVVIIPSQGEYPLDENGEPIRNVTPPQNASAYPQVTEEGYNTQHNRKL